MEWREIAEQASKETDPKRMAELIRQLLEALEEKKTRVLDGDRTLIRGGRGAP